MSDASKPSADANIIALAEHEKSGTQKATQASALIALAAEHHVELFHTPDGESYASVKLGSQLASWPVASKEFRGFLTNKYLEITERAPGNHALTDAINTLGAKARHQGPCRPVFVRTAEVGEVIWVQFPSLGGRSRVGSIACGAGGGEPAA